MQWDSYLVQVSLQKIPEELSNVVKFLLHGGKNVKTQSRSLSYIHIYSAGYI